MTLSKSPKVINSFMSDILEKIVAVKKQELAAAQLRADYSSMRHLAEQSLSLDACDLKPRDFVRAIKQKIASGQAAVIAEIKRPARQRVCCAMILCQAKSHSPMPMVEPRACLY